jgi:hypothetical protein
MFTFEINDFKLRIAELHWSQQLMKLRKIADVRIPEVTFGLELTQQYVLLFEMQVTFLCSSPDTTVIGSDRQGHIARMGEEKWMQHFLKGRDHLDAFGVNGRIILKHIP